MWPCLKRINKNGASFIIIFLFIYFHPRLINYFTKWYNYFVLENNGYNIDNEFNPEYEVVFHLWTRYSNKGDGEKLFVGSEESLLSTYFVSRKTYFIIHGFTNHGLASWVIGMKNALLQREHCNVISVNWQSGKIGGEYFIIKDRVPDVGQHLGQLIEYLKKLSDLKLDQVHLIGHSLGAHVAGFASKYINGQIGRISAIDPASYGYRNVNVDERLDKDDAKFVDVIHTNACNQMSTTILFQGCYGLDENIGDVDFWPNGGDYQTPCHEGTSGIQLTESAATCDHSIGIYYYIETIKPSLLFNKFPSKLCSSWDQFLNDSCSWEWRKQYMGFNAQPRSGVYFLSTNIDAPFFKIDILELIIYLAGNLLFASSIIGLLYYATAQQYFAKDLKISVNDSSQPVET